MNDGVSISVMRARIKNLENGHKSLIKTIVDLETIIGLHNEAHVDNITHMKEAIKTLADEIWGKD